MRVLKKLEYLKLEALYGVQKPEVIRFRIVLLKQILVAYPQSVCKGRGNVHGYQLNFP